MARRPSQTSEASGGQIRFLVYRSPQPLRNGRVQERTRVQRLHFPADARNIHADDPGTVAKRSGRRVNGIAVHYRHQLAPAQPPRGRSRTRVPERWADRTKVVELPDGAKSIRLTNRPP